MTQSPNRGTHQHFQSTHNQFLSTPPTPAKADTLMVNGNATGGRSPTIARSPSHFPASSPIHSNGGIESNHMAIPLGLLGQAESPTLSFANPSSPYMGATTAAGSPALQPITHQSGGNGQTHSLPLPYTSYTAATGQRQGSTHRDPMAGLDRTPSSYSNGMAQLQHQHAGANHNSGAGQGIMANSSAGSVSSSQAVRGPPSPYAGLFGPIGESRSDREVKKSGWLEKFSVGRGFFPVRNWQKRWFQITPDGLNYAKKPGAEMSARTFIPFVAQRKPELRLCPVFLLPNVLPNLHLEATDSKVYYFGLKFEEKAKPHVLLLRTSAAEERDQWVRFLAQFLHVGNLLGIPVSHPLDPSVQRLYDPEQLDTRERLALRRIIVDWDEGYQEYRHKHVDRVNRALHSGVRLGLGGVSIAGSNASLRGGGSSNYERNSSMSSSPQAIINDTVSRTTSAKSAKFTPGGTALINNNNNSNSQPLHSLQQHLDDSSTNNRTGLLPNSPTSSHGHGGGGAFPVDVIIMDDTHVLALTGMDPSMARENFQWDTTLNLDEGHGSGIADYISKGNQSPYQQRQSRSHALTLPSSPPTPTNDDL